MSTKSTQNAVLKVAQNHAANLTIEGHAEDLEDTLVKTYLIDDLGNKTRVGQGLGTDGGVKFIIAVAFDVPPGEYRLEVWSKKHGILIPMPKNFSTVKVYDTKSEN